MSSSYRESSEKAKAPSRPHDDKPYRVMKRWTLAKHTWGRDGQWFCAHKAATRKKAREWMAGEQSKDEVETYPGVAKIRRAEFKIEGPI